jgi:hypothetical protein
MPRKDYNPEGIIWQEALQMGGANSAHVKLLFLSFQRHIPTSARSRKAHLSRINGLLPKSPTRH